LKKKLAKRAWLVKIGAMTTNTADDTTWLTFAEEMELAKEEREWLEDNDALWEELND
jgi:hypothetical protein